MAITTYYKTPTYGIDKIIQSIQTTISNKLKWSDVVDIYGKIQRTEKNNGFFPEVWTSNKEYKEIFVDDRVGAIIGFYVKSPRLIEGYYKEADVDVICTCNLNKIFSNQNRDDEKALNELADILEKNVYVTSLNSIKENISNVFSDFNTENIKHRDMQPFYVFSINITVKYSQDDC